MEDKKERNKIIVKQVEGGLLTLEAIGKMHGITRERVRQLYKRATGKRVSARNERIKREKELAKERHLQEIKYFCRGCRAPVTYGQSKHKKFFCDKCHKLSQEEHRKLTLTFICLMCNQPFHPRYQWKQRIKSNQTPFHNISCYLAFIKKYGWPAARGISAVEYIKSIKSLSGGTRQG